MRELSARRRATSLTKLTKFGDCSAEYLRLRAIPLRWGFVLVRNPDRRHGLVHIVHADTFGALAKLIIQGVAVRTLCDRASVSATWEMIPRLPNQSGYLISCAMCRGALSRAGY